MSTPTPERFRRAASRYATGIAIVTTHWDGIDHAMTANSFTSVSLDPLLALVCVERSTRFHEAVLDAGVWAVSFLAEGGASTARWFATRGRPLEGQFAAVPTQRGANGCLVLADRLAGLELTTTQVIHAGDHDIVLGRVTEVHEPAEDPEAEDTADHSADHTAAHASGMAPGHEAHAAAHPADDATDHASGLTPGHPADAAAGLTPGHPTDDTAGHAAPPTGNRTGNAPGPTVYYASGFHRLA